MLQKFTLREIAGNLTELRKNLRDGKARVNWAKKDGFRETIAALFGLKPTDFSAHYFHRSTLERFAQLFAVPRGPGLDWRNPTPDEIAWALQNFINRRAKPWSFFEVKMMGRIADDETDEEFVEEIEQIMDPGPNDDHPDQFEPLSTK